GCWVKNGDRIYAAIRDRKGHFFGLLTNDLNFIRRDPYLLQERISEELWSTAERRRQLALGLLEVRRRVGNVAITASHHSDFFDRAAHGLPFRVPAKERTGHHWHSDLAGDGAGHGC